jgi:hypothetical protein
MSPDRSPLMILSATYSLVCEFCAKFYEKPVNKGPEEITKRLKNPNKS